MDSEALTTFLAVHEEGGVSAAALKLGRTQSAISRRLAGLEDQLGVRLFERIGKKLVLSEAGAVLLPHAKRATAAVQDALAAVRTVMSEEGGNIRLVCVGTLADSRLTQVLQMMKQRFPKCTLRLQTATSDEVSMLIEKGEADIGLRYHEDLSPDLDCAVAWQEQLVVACSPQHNLADRGVRSLKDLSGEQWLAFPNDAERQEAYAATIFAQFQVHGIADLDWVPVDSLTAQKRLIEADFGIALLQQSAIAEEVRRQSIAQINVRGLTAQIPVCLLKRKSGLLSSAGRALCDALMPQP